MSKLKSRKATFNTIISTSDFALGEAMYWLRDHWNDFRANFGGIGYRAEVSLKFIPYGGNE